MYISLSRDMYVLPYMFLVFPKTFLFQDAVVLSFFFCTRKNSQTSTTLKPQTLDFIGLVSTTPFANRTFRFFWLLEIQLSQI